MSNLTDILNKAKEQAANLPAVTPFPAAVPAVQSSSYNTDMDSFLNGGGMEVESYVQVKDAGIRLNKDWGGYLDEFTVIIDLSEVAPFWGIRKEVGSNVSYAKSYDGNTTVRGENFHEIISKFKAESQKPAEPYRGFDIPMTLVDDCADPKDAKKVLEAGTVVGLSTSITGFKPAASFIKKLNNAGLGSQTVVVKVKHSPRRNAANQEYGVCEFEYVGLASELQRAA